MGRDYGWLERVYHRDSNDLGSGRTHHKDSKTQRENDGKIERMFLDGDGRDPSRYPEIDALKEAVATHAPEEDLRVILRSHARRRLEDAKGREFACDVQEDRQLQAAILHLLRKLNRNPRDYSSYEAYAPDG